MKIGIITNFLDESSGGIATYTHNLIKNINRIDNNNEYVLIHHTKNDIAVYKNNDEIIIPIIKTPFKWLLWRFFRLPISFINNRYYSLDMVHDTFEIGPLTFNLPIKKIITIYDLSAYLYPQYHTLINFLLHRLLLKRAISNANRILTISQYSKDAIVKYFDINPNKVVVTSLGVDEKYKVCKDRKILNSTRLKYKLPIKFILYVGTLEPRKNVPGLLRAYLRLAKKNQIPLVIVGKKGWRYAEIFKTIEASNSKNMFIFLGHVPDEDLPIIYNLASVFVYPSFYEGFGLPILEAMSCGCPVITSNTSSLPEVSGGASILINPYKIQTLTKAISDVLSKDELRKSMIEKGLKQASKFSWEKCAKQTLEVYNGR